ARLISDVARRGVDRRAANCRAPAAECADADRHGCGVAVHDHDLIRRNAELHSHELRPGGFVALAVRRGPGDDRDPAVRIRPNSGALEKLTFGTEARHLDIGRDPNADEPTCLASLLLGGAELVVAGDRDGSLQDGWIVAAVV